MNKMLYSKFKIYLISVLDCNLCIKFEFNNIIINHIA